MCSKKQISNVLVVVFIPSVIALLATLIEYVISPPRIDCIPFGRLIPESFATFLIVIIAFIVICVYGMITLYHLLLLLIAIFKRGRYGNNLIAIIKHNMFCIVTLITLFIIFMWNPNEPTPCDCEKVDCDCILQHGYRIDSRYPKDNNK